MADLWRLFLPPLGVKVALWRDPIHATVTRPGRDESPVFFRLNGCPVLWFGEFFFFFFPAVSKRCCGPKLDVAPLLSVYMRSDAMLCMRGTGRWGDPLSPYLSFSRISCPVNLFPRVRPSLTQVRMWTHSGRCNLQPGRRRVQCSYACVEYSELMLASSPPRW